MKSSHPLPVHYALTHVARFVDDVRAWGWPRAPGRKASPAAGEEREATPRWEDEGGNVK